uniref:UBX domain-containing protein n=1 Tax=Arcella intermedia TaxID=1963864 RepID=A0A6B2LA25_9EUKA
MSEVSTRDFCSLAISPDNPDRSLLANVLEANDIPLWVALVSKRNVAHWRQIFNLQFPHPLFVLAAHMQGSFTILTILSELVLAKDLANIIQQELQTWAQYCEEEQSKMEVIQRNREIAEEQDRLYHMSVAEDEKKKELENILEEQEKLKQMLIQKEWEKAIQLLETLTPEPSGSEKSVRIGIRLPEGQRIDRKFHPTSKLNEIFDFIAGSYAKTKTPQTFINEADPNTPWDIQNYYLLQNFPKQTYTTQDANKTISEAQIGGNLFLTKKT